MAFATFPAEELDDNQRRTIEHVHGPLLVVAGAGTGKTTVLIRRIARLIREGHARPHEILALTYTDNAAQVMADRIRDELRGTGLPGLQSTTFHAYCHNLLIRCGKQFDVLDEKDLWIYLRRRIRDLQLKHFVRAANVSQFLEDLLDFMRRCQDELVTPEKYAEYVRRLENGEVPIPRVTRSKHADELSDQEVLARCQEIAGVFASVERMLREDNLGSFGHMITNAYQLLEQDAQLLAGERSRARFILVDEFQDANFAQVKILQKLVGDDCNIFAVGDPDQAIYRFRGASSAAFSLFTRHFPGTRLLTLGRNRRSTGPILRCAFALIDKNPPGFGVPGSSRQKRKLLQSARDEEAAKQGQPPDRAPVEVVLSDKDLESFDVVSVIREVQRQTKCSWSSFAILYRQHSHREEVVSELIENQVPFAIENMDVLDTPEARDLLACLGAIVSPQDDASLFRVSALPQFAIQPEKLRAAMASAGRDTSLATVLPQVEGGPAVLAALQQAREEISASGAPALAALQMIIRRFAFDRDSPATCAVLDFVKTWQQKPKAITRTGGAAELFDYLEYFREAHGVIPLAPHILNAVNLMTVHAAKGLEFPHVFILRANSGSFPLGYREPLVEFPAALRDPDSVALEEGKVLNEQEERRLFYVAMTRARDTLRIYARPGKGKRDNTPAGFLRDLLKDAGLGRWLRQRGARELQTDMFGEAAAPRPAAASRAGEWLSLEPALDLSARLSATAVETYKTCPMQFKLEREWRLPREVPAAMQYGAVMHRVLRTFYDSVRQGRPKSEAELIDLFRADLLSCGIPDRYQHDLYERQGIAQLQDFLAAARLHPPAEVLHTEEGFEVRIGNTVVAGRMDRVDRTADGRVVIVDYKTGKPKSQEDADQSLQLSIYALAAREKWGYEVERLIFYNLEENSAVSTTRNQAQMLNARTTVEEVAQQIAAGDFHAKTGFHCRFCPYRYLCPATERESYEMDAHRAQARRAVN